MKKLLITMMMIVGCFYIMMMTTYSESLNQIEINVEKEDIAVTFLSSNHVKVLLIQNQKEKILLVLETLGFIDLKKELPILQHENITEYIILNESIKERIKQKEPNILNDKISYSNFVLIKDNHLVLIEHSDQKFCIGDQNDKMLERCDYIYYHGVDKIVEVDEHVKLLMYDESISEDMRLINYDNWIDTLLLSKKNYYTLRWNKDTYQTIMIPRWTS